VENPVAGILQEGCCRLVYSTINFSIMFAIIMVQLKGKAIF
jgi:hypothetical protein